MPVINAMQVMQVKEGGGVKGRLELFRKFTRFGTVTRP